MGKEGLEEVGGIGMYAVVDVVVEEGLVAQGLGDGRA